MSHPTFLGLNHSMTHLNEEQKMHFLVQYNQQSMNLQSANIFAFFNLDRIYFGEILLGLLKLLVTAFGLFSGQILLVLGLPELLAAFFLLWWLIDLFTLKNRVLEFNRVIALRIIASMDLVEMSKRF